jgi:hypothetical protein
MSNEELHELKREMLKDIDNLKREYKSFKRSVAVIANMFIPGIGFILYGSSYLKGIITFILFALYNLVYFLFISPNVGGSSIQVLCYIPAIAVWYVSIAMVGRLDD